MTTRPNALGLYKRQTLVSRVCNSTGPNRHKKLGSVINGRPKKLEFRLTVRSKTHEFDMIIKLKTLKIFSIFLIIFFLLLIHCKICTHILVFFY